MNRLALAVALCALPFATSGCIFFTPPTGVCVSEPCRAFDVSRQEAAAAAAASAAQAPSGALQYRATDFELTFPGIWGELAITTKDEQGKESTAPLRDQTEASGVSTLRIAVGGLLASTAGGASSSEGIRVITLNAGFDPSNEAQALEAIADIARRSIALSFEGTPAILEAQTTLSGKPAYQVSMGGKSKGGGVDLRVIARAALHRKRGYIVLLSTSESRYGQAKEAYDGLFEGFKLLEADPTYVLPSPAPSPTGSAGPSPSPATGSPSPATGSPTPAAGSSSPATGSPSPATGSPTPTTVSPRPVASLTAVHVG